MLRSAWTPQISLKRALDESRVWERRIELAVMLRSAPRIAWLEGAVVNGYEFVPLDTVEEFLAESAAMNNCLDQYGEQLALGMNRVYSIRLNGKRIADIEIGGHNDDATVPAIVQLRGPRNHRVGPHIWRAAYAWMASQPANIVKSPSRTLARKARDDLREQLWAPYLDALGTTPYTERIRAFIINREAAARRLANFAAEMVSCARTR